MINSLWFWSISTKIYSFIHWYIASKTRPLSTIETTIVFHFLNSFFIHYFRFRKRLFLTTGSASGFSFLNNQFINNSLLKSLQQNVLLTTHILSFKISRISITSTCTSIDIHFIIVQKDIHWVRTIKCPYSITIMILRT